MKQPTRGRITLRTAGASDAKKLHALIQANLEEGHLLPRTLGELVIHAERFVVAVKARRIVGCAELAPLSPHVADFLFRFQDFQLGIHLADAVNHRVDDRSHLLASRIHVQREEARLRALHRHAPGPRLQLLIHQRPVLRVVEANSLMFVQRRHG